MIQEFIYPEVFGVCYDFECVLSDAQIIAQMNRVRNTLDWRHWLSFFPIVSSLVETTQNNCSDVFSEFLDSSNLTRVAEYRTLVFIGDFHLFTGGSYVVRSRGLTDLDNAGLSLGMIFKNDLQCITHLQGAIASDSAAHFEQLMFG